MLRIRLIEELEVPYRNRFEQLQQELELSREQFYAQRRETGVLREEFESMASLHVKELEGVRDEYELKLGELRARLRSMQALAEDTTDKERMAGFYRENIALKSNNNQLLQELEDVRKAKENAIIEREQGAAKHAKALADEVMTARTLQLQKEQLERRVDHLEQKFGETPQDSYQQQMGRLQEEADVHRQKQEEMENILGAERNSMQARLLEQQREAAQREAELQQELSAAKSKVEQLKEELVQQERMFQVQRQSMLSEFDEERAHMQQNADTMAREVEEASVKVAELGAAKVEELATAEDKVEAMESELASQLEQLKVMEATKDEGSQQVMALEAKIEALQHESQGRAAALSDCQREREELEDATRRSVEENAELRQSRKKLATESGKRRRAQAKERAAFLAKVEALKRSVAKEHAQAKAAVAQGETNKKKAKQEVAKLRHQVKLLMGQMHARASSPVEGQRSQLAPLDMNAGAAHSDAESGGFSDGGGGSRR